MMAASFEEYPPIESYGGDLTPLKGNGAASNQEQPKVSHVAAALGKISPGLLWIISPDR
jgi:hypothetical protein